MSKLALVSAASLISGVALAGEPYEARTLGFEAAEKSGSIELAWRGGDREHRVEVYTTNWCPYCKRAREYLVSKGIDFADYDVGKDREAAARKKELHGTCGVPV